jgi:hypothetical protein
MLDDTIAPALYRTGKGDRAIPFALSLLGLAALPVLAWLSGPYLWPWGVAALAVVAAGTAAFFARWRQAKETVTWDEAAVEFRRGRRVLTLDPDALTAVDVRPAAVWTRLDAGPHRWKLSHRLVGADELLDRLRRRRPDLFPEPGEELTLRVSAAVAVFQVVLAAGAVGAGWLLLPWQPWLGVGFGLAGAFAFFRVLLYIPRLYKVGDGRLVVVYWLRRRVWRRPDSVREDSYAAGGAVFFRLQLCYSSRAVVLDEGQLNDPLRPRAGWITQKVMAPSDG